MSNRFHNKYHRHSHHTIPLSGDVDAASDPIASADNPFSGEFHLMGNLTISGDMIIDGDLEMHQYQIVNCDATTSKYGVVRIATDAEASARIVSDCVVNPKQLNELIQKIDIQNTPHELISSLHVDSNLSGSLLDGDILYYQNGAWSNQRPSGIYAKLATNSEASEGISTSTAITQRQLHTEIRRNKPIYVSSATPESISSVFTAMSAEQNAISDGTLAFTYWNQQVVVGWGNGGASVNVPSVSIWKYSSGSWIKVY
jgi:hypothetical protein